MDQEANVSNNPTAQEPQSLRRLLNEDSIRKLAGQQLPLF